MSIIIKKVNGLEYAYLVTREGSRVVHRYLGPKSSKEVIKKINDKNRHTQIPDDLHTLFWDTDHEKVKLGKNSRYIIERVLEFGNIGAIKWLQMVYSGKKIIDVLTTARNISDKSKNFWLIWFYGAEKNV